MKKALSIIVALVMVCIMCVPSFATKLTTDIPYEHTVTVTYNEGGTVLLEGRVCPNGAQVKINRFGEIDLSTILENGYHLEKVTVNGVDVTEYYKDGNIKVTNITDDVHVNFTFQKCSEDPNDKCEKVSMSGNVYLGDKKLPGAEMSFDFGSVVTSTDGDGRYYVEDIAEGRHIVTISKDGEALAHITFVIEFADVDEVTLRTAADGTQVVQVPYGTDIIYLDFYIIDSDDDGIPDQDPDKTDPNNPDIDPDKPNIYPDPDDDNDGIPDEDDPDHPNYDGDDDGIPDNKDPDDDNDGIPDDKDPDDDNDGIPDKDDPDHPDRDTDGDGIPDKDDDDDDDDGIPDKDDPDDDNDGIPDVDDPDSPDRDTDGDGIPDRDDDDDDNDGLPDGDQDWDDNDGDGIPDDKDPDDDNDGIPDVDDPDADGDGHHDDYDGDDEGDYDDDGGKIEINNPKPIIPGVDIPDTSAELMRSPIPYGIVLGFIFFFIILFFKRKKDEEEDEVVEITE